MIRTTIIAPIAVLSALLAAPLRADDPDAVDFRKDVAPLLTAKCVSCHNPAQKKGDLDLTTRKSLVTGGESGFTVTPGEPDASLLIDYISGEKPEMPKTGEKLTEAQIETLTRWVAAGLPWPEDLTLNVDDAKWWSLRTLKQPAVPEIPNQHGASIRTPIDAFIRKQLAARDLHPSPPADRRTLIRRLKFDLLGLPPTPEETDAFVNDPDPLAWERLIDRYLDSPHYGERWARHWLDVVHYGDTHGYDKDKLRTNAWPYRDYVIRAFNDDKPYAQFVREQIAGDVLEPGNPDGVVATGFIAAGPWDFISHVEVPESKIDGQIARNLDRDDMVRTTMETFTSATIGCARCHNHKFDPFTMEDYYSLQAVFAAVDRADRPFDKNPDTFRRRQELAAQHARLAQTKAALDADVRRLAGERLKPIDAEIAKLEKSGTEGAKPEFGYHSRVSATQDATKWVQVDLGEPREIRRILYVGCHDNFNNIGAGFGFPVRYKIEASDDAGFQSGVTLLADHTEKDAVNPGVEPQILNGLNVTARYIRVTATRLALRKDDYIFALAELQVFGPDGNNQAAGRTVTALDSIEAPVRWRKSNLVDGYYFGIQLGEEKQKKLAELNVKRKAVLAEALPTDLRSQLEKVETQLSALEAKQKALPPAQKVYAAAVNFAPQGNFKPTGGAPREIRLLHRGNIKTPGDVMHAGALHAIDQLHGRFDLPDPASEGDRRAALAEWITDRNNPLTWRSIVNRVWLYHFGRGIVDSPNDFGRMGQSPTHPELLDWLAVRFRDSGQSLKELHRLICRSAVYRQSSADDPASSAVDSGNRWLWRMNRRRLEAEAIRDSVLAVSGMLKPEMYGPGFQDFVIEKPQHSPHYQYHLHDPNDPASHRRAVYRFIVRSQQQPFMTTLDCADPSMQVEKRNQTVTSLQALSLLNNKFMVAMSQHFAERLRKESNNLPGQVVRGFRLAIDRDPDPGEKQLLIDYAQHHGLENACRLLFNLNEFVFVD